MSNSYISDKIKTRLWTLAGGRCQYKGCNRPLWKDELTLGKMNRAYIAHIVADSPDGPRGDKKRSEKLAKDLNNLMLLCDTHHRTIDIEDVKGHPEKLLLKMKKEHEERIDIQTSIIPENKTHIVFYGANIGQQGAPLSYSRSQQAIIPQMFPFSEYPIELGMINSSWQDSDNEYWNIENTNLMRQFNEKVNPIRLHNSVKNFSLFALAPQPLLIRLGTLFSDLYIVDVFQLHREPATWEWQTNYPFDGFELIPPKEYDGIPVLNLSLSATITEDRITKVLDSKASIWTITHKSPNNDFLKTRNILSEFRRICRTFFDNVKSIHGQDSVLHVFPAMPVSAAVEFGRLRMPKADVPMVIYDQIKSDGFTKAIEI